MDFSSEEAAIDLFGVGPSSALGKAIAVQVIFCRYFKEFVAAMLGALVRQWRRYRRIMGLVVGKLFTLLNPRNPSVLLAAVVFTMFFVSRSKRVSQKAEATYRRKFWSNLMKSALTYDEWAHAASMLEKANDRKKDSDLYDEELVSSKLNELQLRRLEGGVEDILFCLRADLVRNLGNMCNPELHKGRLQTPRVIQDYINEVRYHLRAVCETDSDEFSPEEKIAFIHETRHAFGRTALLLSGGAALGAFHLGVVRTLIEHRLLPRVVAGASVGSITCSFTATRTWSELQSFFDDPMPPMHFFESMGSIIATAHRLLTRGAINEIGQLQRKMRQLIGDLTFQEAYDLSGRVLGISVCSPRRLEPPRCLNYLTSPHVVIWSAVTASCAFPGLFEAQELMAKDRHGRLVPFHTPPQFGLEEPNMERRQWRDGSLESDLPMLQLKELFNVNHFIVSQANPHIAPLLRLKECVRAYGGDFAAKLAHISEMEVKHRCKQALEMGFHLGGVAKLFAQDWEGDVTIVMPATIAQFAKIITNPTPSDLRKAVMQGRRCTWEKLSAIQANCGIELMLDECVSELNRRRKAHREAERNSSHVLGGAFSRMSTSKRIPSWNCLARESSWGSLDEDGMDVGLHPQLGGPWGGPSLRTLRPARTSHEGSDSDSGTENLELSNLSWTRAGGPLMRTASAVKFISGFENEGELLDQGRTYHDSGEETDAGQANIPNAPKLSPRSWSFRSGKRANKIWGRSGATSPGSSDNKSEDNDSCEERDFSVALNTRLRKSASTGLVSPHSNSSKDSGMQTNHSADIAGDCHDSFKGVEIQAHGSNFLDLKVSRRSRSQGRLHGDLDRCSLSPKHKQNEEDLEIGAASARELSRATRLDSVEGPEAEARVLQKAFGSFISEPCGHGETEVVESSVHV